MIVLGAALAVPATLAPAPAQAGSSRVAVYVVAHADDELLFLGSDIRLHLEAGTEVHVVLATDGSATVAGARLYKLGLVDHLPTALEIERHRDQEFRASCHALGVKAANCHLSTPGIPRAVNDDLTVDQATAIFAYWQRAFPGRTVALKTQSPWDYQVDHVALGTALDRMSADGRVGDARFFFKSYLRDGVPTHPGLHSVLRAVGDSEQDGYRVQVFDGRKLYGVVDRWGLGYLSVPSDFNEHRADPTAFWHLPSAADLRWTQADREATVAWVAANGGYDGNGADGSVALRTHGAPTARVESRVDALIETVPVLPQSERRDD